MTDIKTADLAAAHAGSYYTIAGAGGDLQEWITGYGDLLEQEGIGRPAAWFQTTGQAVNTFAGPAVASRDQFPSDLAILLFPLDGLAVGKLAIFKLRMRDRWFDDVVDNMRPAGEEDQS
jgi:hypothetical protein